MANIDQHSPFFSQERAPMSVRTHPVMFILFSIVTCQYPYRFYSATCAVPWPRVRRLIRALTFHVCNTHRRHRAA